MNSRHATLAIVVVMFLLVSPLFAQKIEKFNTQVVDELWTGLWQGMWKETDPTVKEPKIDPLTDKDVLESICGKWTAPGFMQSDGTTNTVTYLFRTDHTVVLSAIDEGKAWKNPGQWRVFSNKLLLFLKDNSGLPSFIFRSDGKHYIWDPTSKGLKLELKRAK